MSNCVSIHKVQTVQRSTLEPASKKKAPPKLTSQSSSDAGWSSILRKTGIDLAKSPTKKSDDPVNPWGVALKKRGTPSEDQPRERSATTSAIDYRAALRRRPGAQVSSPAKPGTPEKSSTVDYLGQLKRSSPAVSPAKPESPASNSSSSVNYLAALKPRGTGSQRHDPQMRPRSATTSALDYRSVLKTGANRSAESSVYGGNVDRERKPEQAKSLMSKTEEPTRANENKSGSESSQPSIPPEWEIDMDGAVDI